MDYLADKRFAMPIVYSSLTQPQLSSAIWEAGHEKRKEVWDEPLELVEQYDDQVKEKWGGVITKA
tara:strand:- start:19 stop:213 length:195 start_codon:yes stop_codon:yes gene_type:complete